MSERRYTDTTLGRDTAASAKHHLPEGASLDTAHAPNRRMRRALEAMKRERDRRDRRKS